MANEQNLVPINQRAKSEQREIREKGTKASAKARRECAMLREAADLILCRKLPPGEHNELLETLGIPKTERTQAMLAALGMVVGAQNGNPAAFKRLMELRGEGVEKKEVSVSTNSGQLGSLLEALERHESTCGEENGLSP